MITPIVESQTLKIVYDYFVDHYSDQRTAITEYNKLRMILNNYDDHRLVSFGNIVFLLNFKQDEVEFHSMGRETSAFAFTKDIIKLINYVRKLNVKSISTYGNDQIFEHIARRLKLDIKQQLKVKPDGNTYNYYRLEF
tara:strand:- start:1996 stop:2409 length:414 start_codon:yes stop_codon:yes gene_type:complete